MLRTRSISTIGAILALAIPAAAGAQQDLRSPDAKDAQQAAQPTSTPQDLRSPGAVDVRHAALVAGQQQDLRSPDARDAAGQGQLPPIVVTPAAPAATPSASNGFEWGDAAIGAAGMLGLVALITGAGLIAVRYRHGHDGGGMITPSH
jgi:uncharacterized iron-regulated membrane protein